MTVNESEMMAGYKDIIEGYKNMIDLRNDQLKAHPELIDLNNIYKRINEEDDR